MADGSSESREVLSDAGAPGHVLSPTRVFFALLLLVAMITAAAVLLVPSVEVPTVRAAPGSTPTSEEERVIPEPSPEEGSVRLSDTEAINRLRHLLALRDRAYRERSGRLFSSYLTPTSPLLANGYKDMRILRRNDLRLRDKVLRRRLTVIANADRRILLREVVVSSTKIVTRAGKVISKDKRPVFKRIIWVLLLDGGVFKIDGADTIESHPVRQRADR